jgi:MoaA/NifB/PqqE/SkfB family radical SAM enzyme
LFRRKRKKERLVGERRSESLTVVGQEAVGPPRFLFMHMYESCNLRCTHCTFWQRPNTLGRRGGWTDLAREQHRARREGIVAEFADLNPRGVVVTHGGEALLDWDDYLRLCGLCRARGLRLFTVTNGTAISSLERAEQLVVEGPSEISVSFDGIRPEVHDSFRGVKGAFAKATAAVVALLRARYERHSTIKIYAMLLVGKSTYEELDAAYDFALNDLGVDKLKLNMVQPSFGNESGDDEFFAKEHDVDPDKLREILWRVDEKYQLGFNPTWVGQVAMYFRSLRGQPLVGRGWQGDLATSEHICNSYDRNVWVSDRSVMQLCCDSRWAGKEWRKIGDLRAFWEAAQPQRDQMASCNRLCGISHSLRNTSSTRGAFRHGR